MTSLNCLFTTKTTGTCGFPALRATSLSKIVAFLGGKYQILEGENSRDRHSTKSHPVKSSSESKIWFISGWRLLRSHPAAAKANRANRRGVAQGVTVYLGASSPRNTPPASDGWLAGVEMTPGSSATVWLERWSRCSPEGWWGQKSN